MAEIWKTKYGLRRVRNDPPTLDEAIAAARDLTDDPRQQAEIAASLMAVPVETAEERLMKAPARRQPTATIAFAGRAGARAVVVERKISRRPAAAQPLARRRAT
jgi:hypothetical protein